MAVSARSFSYAEASDRPHSVAGLRLDSIADPGYETHPAYGLAFPHPGFALRVRALAQLAPWLLFAVAKQVLLGDRLPALPRDGDGLDGGILRRLRALPRYLPLIAKILAAHFSPSPGAGSGKTVSPLASVLKDDGIVVARMPAEELAQLNRRVQEPIEEICRRRQESTTTSFKGNQKCFTWQEDPAEYDSVTSILSQVGLLEAASTYLNRPVTLTRLVLQVNDARDTYLYTSFPDAGLKNSATNYMHIDRAFSCVKCVIYLNEVGSENGPFSYVLGSNRIDQGFLGGVVRRAVDRAGLAGSDRKTRRLFMALPRALRKKSAFGADLLDGSANSELLLGSEYCFTSDAGNIAMFDNLGIHRGALVLKGQRKALFATLA